MRSMASTNPKEVSMRDVAEHLEDGVVSVKHAREFLDCSRTKLYELLDINGGPLVSLRVDGTRRVARRSLREYLAGQVNGEEVESPLARERADRLAERRANIG